MWNCCFEAIRESGDSLLFTGHERRVAKLPRQLGLVIKNITPSGFREFMEHISITISPFQGLKLLLSD
jgi:hypothetical protein